MKTKKAYLKDYVEYMSEEQAAFMLKVVRAFSNTYITKGQNLELTTPNTNGIDTAIPLQYADRIKEIHPNFSTMFHVYDYRTATFGEMLNVAEAFVLEMQSVMSGKREQENDKVELKQTA